jgi:hypothetical protein
MQADKRWLTRVSDRSRMRIPRYCDDDRREDDEDGLAYDEEQ